MITTKLKIILTIAGLTTFGFTFACNTETKTPDEQQKDIDKVYVTIRIQGCDYIGYGKLNGKYYPETLTLKGNGNCSCDKGK